MPTEKIFSTSFAQEGLLDSTKSNGYRSYIVLANGLLGPLNVAILKETLEMIIDRHWILRTEFFAEDHKSCQVIDSIKTEFFFEKDFRSVSPDKLEDSVLEELRRLHDLVDLDVTKPPLMRCDLLRVGDEEYYLTIKVHHIACDGLSLDILRKEIKDIYTAKTKNSLPTLPKLSTQYVDFADRERKHNASSNMVERVKYWKETLTGLPSLNLVEALAAKSNDREVATAFGAIEDPLVEMIKGFCKKHRTTFYQTVLLATTILLHRLTRQDDIFFMSGFSVRPPEELDLIGFFTTTLPIRINHKGSTSPITLLQEVRKRSLEAWTNQIHLLKFDEISLNENDKNAFEAPILTLNFTAGLQSQLDLPEILAKNVDMHTPPYTGTGLYLRVSVLAEITTFYFSYDPNVFKEEVMTKIAQQFKDILNEIALA